MLENYCFWFPANKLILVLVLAPPPLPDYVIYEFMIFMPRLEASRPRLVGLSVGLSVCLSSKQVLLW
jgi:hypothetical protein